MIAVAGVLEAFVRQTWLTATGIHQRSVFGQMKFVPYGQVQEIVIERDVALVVKYRDNRRLKVLAKEGAPDEIIEAARPFLNPEIRVVSI